MKWIAENENTPDNETPILITGLPGIGNVGKTVIDFIIEEKKADKVCDFFSHDMPHSVYVDEDHLVEMPKISLYAYDRWLLLSGDAQPIDERGCYAFCTYLLEYIKKYNVKEIITLGGIGLENLPKDPKVYITGTSQEIVKKYSTDNTETKIHGVVGPILGVTGLLMGLSKRQGMPAASLLAETLGHPMYLGLRGSRAILRHFMDIFDMEFNLENLEKEIADFEQKMKLAEELGKVSKERINYIG